MVDTFTIFPNLIVKMSDDAGDRRRGSDHYPTLDTTHLLKPIDGVITYFQSVSINLSAHSLNHDILADHKVI